MMTDKEQVMVAINKEGRVRARAWLEGNSHDSQWAWVYIKEGYTVKLMDRDESSEAMSSQRNVLLAEGGE